MPHGIREHYLAASLANEQANATKGEEDKKIHREDYRARTRHSADEFGHYGFSTKQLRGGHVVVVSTCYFKVRQRLGGRRPGRHGKPMDGLTTRTGEHARREPLFNQDKADSFSFHAAQYPSPRLPPSHPPRRRRCHHDLRLVQANARHPGAKVRSRPYPPSLLEHPQTSGRTMSSKTHACDGVSSHGPEETVLTGRPTVSTRARRCGAAST